MARAGGPGESGRIIVKGTTGLESMAEDLIEEMKRDAEARMPGAQEHAVQAVRYELGKAGDGPAPAGEAPRFRTGELLLSWEVGKRRWVDRFGKLELQGFIESDHEAAGALEWGAPRLGIEAHPYVRPAFARIEGEIERLLTGGR